MFLLVHRERMSLGTPSCALNVFWAPGLCEACATHMAADTTEIRLLPLCYLTLAYWTLPLWSLMGKWKTPSEYSVLFWRFSLAHEEERRMMVCLHQYTFSRVRSSEEHVPHMPWEFVFHFNDFQVEGYQWQFYQWLSHTLWLLKTQHSQQTD